MENEATFEAVMGRLRQAVGAPSESALAKELGMKQSAFSNRKKTGSIPFENVIRLAIARDLDLRWLFQDVDQETFHEVTEAGHAIAEDLERYSLAEPGGRTAAFRTRRRDGSEGPDFSDFELVQRRGIVGSAGGGAENIVTANEGAIAFRRDYLRRRGVRANQLIAADVSGDSMEPTLYHCDLVVFDSQFIEITTEDIYLFDLEGRLFIKRLRYKLGGVVEIISDNREKYPPMELTEEQADAYNFDVRGRFFWRGGDRLQ